MIQTRVCGIPAQVEITAYSPGRTARLWGHPDTWAPPEFVEFEYQILDRRGRPAPWLARKLTDADRRDIEKLIMAGTRTDWD